LTTGSACGAVSKPSRALEGTEAAPDRPSWNQGGCGLGRPRLGFGSTIETKDCAWSRQKDSEGATGKKGRYYRGKRRARRGITHRAGLPVEQPTKFEFVINLNTAKALEIKIPRSVLPTRLSSEPTSGCARRSRHLHAGNVKEKVDPLPG
jgi:hypothetical protein